MQVRFLIGPAGSGKTWRCLSEIRDRLKAEPLGPPLILLAPKQATFQLERQLLADPELAGFTRLQIVSFDRLARFVLDELAFTAPKLLDEEGRVMVLRALLARHRDELQLYRASALRPGLAGQLSQVLREFQRQRISPDRLAEIAVGVTDPETLRLKLHDLALLMRGYRDWLAANEIEDSDHLLDIAADAFVAQASSLHGTVSRSNATSNHPDLSVGNNPPPTGGTPAPRDPISDLQITGLWLDGFAEMTPQEINLLHAVLPFCSAATLAFCLDSAPETAPPWNSIWSMVGHSFCACRDQLAGSPDIELITEELPRSAAVGRFANRPALAWLEKQWTHFTTDELPDNVSNDLPTRIRLTECANPEYEAVHAAREIIRHVQAGGRYRETAVMVRSLEQYAAPIRRVFTRYGIPCFLDQREPVAHHPLAELTRFALRTVAYHWQTADWFGVLKTGLTPLTDGQVDELENAALAHGWSGDRWFAPLEIPTAEERESPSPAPALQAPSSPLGERAGVRGKAATDLSVGVAMESRIRDSNRQSDRLEKIRGKIIPPFGHFRDSLKAKSISSAELADAVVTLWRELKVERRLDEWSTKKFTKDGSHQRHHEPEAIHGTVWRQMAQWLDNLRRAFPDSAGGFSLHEWLPIVDSGLNGLTIGVIPPAIDQVLIGAVDRSRNPDLKLAIVLGLNEGVFPARSAKPVLLTERERDQLADQSAAVGHGHRAARGHERYLAYIAASRATERLVLTYSSADMDGKPLHPSLIVSHVRHLLGGLESTTAPVTNFIAESVSPVELIGPILAAVAQASSLHGTVSCNDRFSNLPDPSVCNHCPPTGGTPALQLAQLGQLPALQSTVERWRELPNHALETRLDAESVEQLFGGEAKLSVSSLERFGECPFKFFASRGLKLEEREEFEVDYAEQGSFQHEILETFHAEATMEGRKWRNLTPDAAADLIGQIGEQKLITYKHGLMNATADRQFQALELIGNLKELIRATVNWLRTSYAFDPRCAELSFGMPGDLSIEWCHELPDGRHLMLRGKIDRVDVCPTDNPDEALAVVIDYKSGAKKLTPWKLEHGIQLQLPFYLNSIVQIPEVRERLGAKSVIPAGMFYVRLRAGAGTVNSRDEDSGGVAFQHAGRYNATWQEQFDGDWREAKSGQFKYRFTKKAEPWKGQGDAVKADDFFSVLKTATAKVDDFGQRILDGDIAVSPFRKGSEIACEYCEFRGVCRFDPWVDSYRPLRSGKTAKVAGGEPV